MTETKSTYVTTSGTEPQLDGPHEPRTIKQVQERGINQMMSEIGDGVFVAWTDCVVCHKHANTCKCAGGPTEPKYIVEWRQKRFLTDLKLRAKAQKPEHEQRLEDEPVVPKKLKPAVSTAESAIDTSPLDKAMSAAADKVEAAKAEVQTPVETDEPDPIVDEDDLAWAKEDLPDDATPDEIAELAATRAQVRADEPSDPPTSMSVKEGENRQATFDKLAAGREAAAAKALEHPDDILDQHPEERDKYRALGLTDGDIKSLLVIKAAGN